jgi:hypothetical protein
MVLYRRRGKSCRLATGETLAGIARLPELLRVEQADVDFQKLGLRGQPFARGVARASICLDDAIAAGSF